MVSLMFYYLKKWRTYAVESRFEIRRFYFKCSCQHSCDPTPCFRSIFMPIKFRVVESYLKDQMEQCNTALRIAFGSRQIYNLYVYILFPFYTEYCFKKCFMQSSFFPFFLSVYSPLKEKVSQMFTEHLLHSVRFREPMMSFVDWKCNLQ